MIPRFYTGWLRGAAVFALAFAVSVASVHAQDSRYVDPILNAQDPTFVVLDGYQLAAAGQNAVFDVPPVIINGATFVEVSGLFTEMGIVLSWYETERRVNGLGVDGTVIDLYVGSTTAYVNGVPYTLPAAPFIATEYGRTMVPLSFVATHMNASVTWIGGQRTIYIQQSAPARSLRDFARSWHVASHAYRGYGSYGEAGPISLSQVVVKYRDGRADEFAWLVGLSGTDTGRSESGEATGFWEDFLIGLLGAQNDYLTNVLLAIENHVPAGSSSNPTRLVLAGHSLGGMVAQQVAAEMKADARYDGYTVLNTVTFGSPLVDAGQREGEVRRLGDKHDPIPQASSESVLLNWWNVLGVNWESAPGFDVIDLDAHNYSYQMAGVWDRYDALGRKDGVAMLRVRPSNTTFYPAPRFKAAVDAVRTGRPQRLDTAPAAFALEGVAPNPVRGYGVIRYTLPETAEVRIELYDVLGRRVSTLLDATQAPGAHTVPVDATALPSGTYLYRIAAGTETKTGRLTVVR